MTRLHGPFASATVIAAALLVAGSGVRAQPASPGSEPEMQIARAGLGSLHGVVTDQDGAPIEGATVSAIGASMVFAITDRNGRFTFTNVVPGQYLVRAHRTGFILTGRDYVDVQDGIRAVKWVELQRAAVGTAGSEPTRILAAGLGPSADATVASPVEQALEEDDGADATVNHPHTDAAWRLRHARRSVLKDAGDRADLLEGETASNGVTLARNASAPLLTGLPFSGEINLLTTSSFDDSGHLFGDGWPRGVTYVSFGSGSEGTAGWEVQAAVSTGDVSSWIVAGSYVAQGLGAHAFDLGGTFGAQQYAGGNPAVLAVRSDGTRQAGTIYAFDNWAVSPGVRLFYGTRMSRYDYVSRDELWSPRVGLSLDIARGTRLRASVGQQMRAPGAEEFLPPAGGGPWLPPERTFSPLTGDDFRVEQIRRVEVSLEREVEDAYVIAVRSFFEAVSDQLVTIFGARTVSDSRSDVGHYLVGNAGAFDASGWGLRLSTPAAKRLRGALDYQITRANWNAAPNPALRAVAASAVRSDREDIHDVATSLEADINETATRVFFYYRVSSAYSREVATAAQPTFGGRFDLQVKQGLPFMPFRGSEWEVLVGIRDLFRDPMDGGSVYDELLVIRPPKRVIGGVQVKF
jgi:hypothetical protein